MMLNSVEILEKIKKLKSLDLERRVFGASSHNYQLNSCLDEGTVKSVENKYNIHLPEDYRRFLLEVGNGGAGPSYGLFKLGEQDRGWGYCSWEDGYLLGNPSASFPYQDKWNLSDAFWSQMPDEEGLSQEEYDIAYEAWDAKLEELYWTPSVMNGAIPICHLGCALRQWLVVTGSEKGNIWCNDRADYGGIYPLVTNESNRVNFSGWYIGWLDEAIGSIEQE